MKSSREQFDEWFPHMVEGMPENMVKVFDEMLFMAWQASRAAIEIELPNKVMVDDDFDSGHNCAINRCADAIHDTGLTVKGDA